MKFCKIIFLVITVLLLNSKIFSVSSLYSATGLILTPSASLISFRGYNVSFSEIHSRDTDGKFTLINASYGLRPELEIGVASTNINDENKMFGSAKYQITKETRVNPGVAIGVVYLPEDIQPIGYKVADQKKDDITYYVVVSQKLIWPREFVKKHSLKGHIGYGGEEVYDGMFGGVELVYSRQLNLLCEYDGNNLNFGANFFLSPGIAVKGTYLKNIWSVGISVEIKGK